MYVCRLHCVGSASSKSWHRSYAMSKAPRQEGPLSGVETMDVIQSTEAQTITQHAARGDRVARTREAIISSTLTLAQDGEVSPIVRDIAKLAGVSARTVFQHFADTAELYVAVLGRVMTSLLGEAPELNRQWPLEQRIGVV